MYDGREGSYGDFNQRITTGGSITTNHELHNAGVNTWDDLGTVEAKLAASRQPFGMPGVSAGTSTYVGSGGSLGFGGKLFVGIFCLIVGGIIALNLQPQVEKYFNLKPNPPNTEFIRIYNAPALLKKMSASSLENMRKTYLENMKGDFARLYKPGTPLESIFSKCSVRPCVEPDFSAFQSFRQYAANPGNYESELCQALVYSIYWDSARLKAEPWKLERMGGPNNAYECKVANPGPMWAKYRAESKTSTILSSLITGVILVAGFTGLMMLGRRKR